MTGKRYRMVRFGLGLVVLLGACSGAEQMLGPTTYDIQGNWELDEQLQSAGGIVLCDGSANLSISQNGPRFTAQGTAYRSCSRGAVAAGSPAITDGTIDKTTFGFHADGCAYTGSAHGARPDSVTGTATCRLSSGSGTVSFSGLWHLIPQHDYTPPTVAGSTFSGGPGGPLETGDDTLYVRIVAQDNTALRAIGYEITDPSRGAVVQRDSILLTADTVATLTDTLIYPLPLHLILPVPDGSPFVATVFARDTAGNPGFGSLAPITVHYPFPPTATGTLTGSIRPDSTAALHDTLAITVSAHGPRRLAYIGYRITSFTNVGDSVAVADTADSAGFRLPIPFAWKGAVLDIEVFVRDRLGLDGGVVIGELRVAVFPSRPTQTFRVGQGVSDMVYDGSRGRLYLMTALDSTPQAGRPEVRVFQFSPAGFLPGIPLSWFAYGIDLTPGQDSLLLTLYNGRLGIINLTTLVQDSTDSIIFAPAAIHAPYKVRSTANGKAMISIAGGFSIDGGPGQFVELDLGTGTQTLRTDVGDSGAIGTQPFLGVTPDRTRLVVYPANVTTTAAQLYQSATDAFAAAVPDPSPGQAGAFNVSTDSTGSHWLVGNELLDGNLAPLRQLESGIYSGTSVLSYDGAYAYVAVPEGVAKVRTSDGTRAELILLQNPPYMLRITPDGTTLIAVGYGLQIVDLR